MAKHASGFVPYREGDPPKVVVWCSERFQHDVKQMLCQLDKSQRANLANMDVLLDRFCSGQQLSKASFRKERVGYAFKAGTLRFYGAYSRNRPGTFVLSHAIVKRHDKLQDTDVQRMNECLRAFDAVQGR